MNAPTSGEATSSLIAEVLHSWGTLQLRANGMSMLPTLWPGDLLTVHSRKFEQVQVGEMVLYFRQGRFFIHRVVGKPVLGGKPVLITRGDCMSKDDPPVRDAELLGTVTMIGRDGACLVPARRLKLPSLILARLLCHCDLFRRVVLRLHAARRDAGSRFNFVPGKAAS